MPLTASFYARNEWGDWDETGEEWDGRTLLDYEDRILGAMVRNRVPEEAEWGLMHWCDKEFLDVKVRSAVFTAEARDGRLWGVAECQVVGQLSPEELTGLKDYLTGQAADGVGEGLEQQAIRVDSGELYVHLWQPGGAGASRRRQSSSGRCRPGNRTITGPPPKPSAAGSVGRGVPAK